MNDDVGEVRIFGFDGKRGTGLDVFDAWEHAA
jgi:hypothetical protein